MTQELEPIVVPPLSTGMPSTLGSYHKLCKAFFGAESGATKFIEKKIAEHELGEDEQVMQAESQMLMLLGQLHIDG